MSLFYKFKKKTYICINKLSLGLSILKKKSNWIIIEGAGGWHTPLSHTFILSDWVKKEKLNIILVVGIKLGCINHAILTQQAILTAGLNFVGWIANYIFPTNSYDQDHINILKKYLISPYLGNIKYDKNINTTLYNLKSTIKLPIIVNNQIILKKNNY